MRHEKWGKKGTIFVLSILIVLWASEELASSEVKIWQESLVIPTYVVGPAERNPIFYTGRAYQGAKGPIYPYPLLDKLSDRKVAKTYKALYLENDFVKICVLPEIGGRIFSAVDKANGYDFIYRQNVIKPALIGMLGAWISGGMEWNVPHHHRATTFMDVDFEMTRNENGSKTVWVGEIELRHRMKWLVGMTLHPENSLLEIDVKILNRTPMVHSILYFANAAVHVNPDYQVFFPPRTEYATHHGKNQFTAWPIADGPFVEIPYRQGTDLSWWKNHPSPVSLFAWNEQDDFLAGYDHGRDAGVVSVADHHQVPGKKFFEWGTGADGRMWEKILTDRDGPYLELMVGAYSDNQPDYSWIQPYEAKVFRHYWYPIEKIGGVKAANLSGAANLDLTSDGKALVCFFTTAAHSNARVLLLSGNKVLHRQSIDIDPSHPYRRVVDLPGIEKSRDLRISLVSAEGIELIAYHPLDSENRPKPTPVMPPLSPGEIGTVEELYLTGLRLEQFYNPALDSLPYFEEALRRDPGDARVNTMLGILLCRRGMFPDAEKKLRLALERLTRGYTRPRDGEAYYYLGVALRAQEKTDAAVESFAKAAWSQAWYGAANHQLAEIASRKGDFTQALELADQVVLGNGFDTKARNLKAALLRRSGRWEEAEKTAEETMAIDPLDPWARNEKYLCLARNESSESTNREADALERQMRGAWQSYLELATDYGNCGLFAEAIDLLSRFRNLSKAPSNPLVLYHLGYYLEKNGEREKGLTCYQLGGRPPLDYCFPFQLESAGVLERVSQSLPSEARPHYLLGNLFFDLQPQRAIDEWEKAVHLDGRLATAHRNLGLAYAQTQSDLARALVHMNRAVELSPGDPRLYYELDLLSEAARVPVSVRLKKLNGNQPVLMKSDESLSRLIMLLIQEGRYDRTISLLERHHFHVWEGGGSIHDVFVDAHLLRGLNRLERKRPREALTDFLAALEYPDNLEVGRPFQGGRESQIFHLIGMAYGSLHDEKRARESFRKSTESRGDPSETSAWSDLDYYRGLSFTRLGESQKGEPLFAGLLGIEKTRLQEKPEPDYFAKFGERQSELSRQAQLHYLIGLGALGMKDRPKAAKEISQAVRLDPNHVWAHFQFRRLK